MFPVLGGVALGLVTHALRGWLKIIVIGLLSVGLGAIAASISGELITSWAYLFIDTAQASAAATMTAFLVTVWLRRRARAAAR